MTLVTFAWTPPSCPARLPQKFSAATTDTTDPSTPPARVAGVVAQAARPKRQHREAANPRGRFQGHTEKLTHNENHYQMLEPA